MSRSLDRAAALAAALILAAGSAGAGSPSPTDPVVAADAAAAYIVQLDGQTIRSRAADVPRQPASLSKLALALVLDEARRSMREGEQLVKVSQRAAAAPPSRLGLRSGDLVAADDLLAAMMIASANDACLALAEQLDRVAGAAIGRMNRLAAHLGMRDTRFADPCGFDRPGQRTSAADLLKLANAALAQPRLRRLAAERSVDVPVRRGLEAAHVLTASTSNALLDRVEGVVGLKTGYTSLAGRSMIAIASQDGHEVVVVVLGARDRFYAATRLLEHGFARVTHHAPAAAAEPTTH